MIERAIEKARQYQDSKRNARRQFAITQARQPLFEIPEDLGVRFTCEIGGKSVEQLVTEAKSVRDFSMPVFDMMTHNPKFTTLEKVTPQTLIKLRVKDLGLPETPTTEQIFERATHSRIGDMALEYCRAEVGPHLAIADKDQPLGYYFIVHEPLADRFGDKHVFRLERNKFGLCLNGGWAHFDRKWFPEDQLVFALRNIEPVKA